MFDLVLAAGLACLPTPQVYDQLTTQYSENRAVAGLNRHGGLLEIWASPEGTWTALITTPDGVSCLFDAGTAFIPYGMAPPGELASSRARAIAPEAKAEAELLK